MTREDVLSLLQNIKINTYVGAAGIDVITFSMEKGLIERTESGNFKLSQKGEDLLNDESDDEIIFTQ